jgi:hypothetical protein
MRYVAGIVGAVAVFALAVFFGDWFGLGGSQSFADISLLVSLAIVVLIVRPWTGLTSRSKWLAWFTTAGCLTLVLFADLYGALWHSCTHGTGCL